jgi:RNA polymerase sigma factor (sigma-70 family)
VTFLADTFDSVLIAARSGEQWAWEAIYRELAPPVLGYLRARGAAEPEDLTGEVFLQVVRDLPGFAGGERDFRAWTFTVAHHRLLDERRRGSRRPVEETPVEAIADQQIVSSAEDEALGRIHEAQVRRVLARLSPDQQSVILLRVLGDLTVEQVAAAIGKSPGAVKALQRRGLAALRREISQIGVTL